MPGPIVYPQVTGTLPVTHGGTGQTTYAPAIDSSRLVNIGADPPPPWYLKLAGVDAGFWAVLLAALILSLARHHVARLSNIP
jgi:hypothetical protein